MLKIQIYVAVVVIVEQIQSQMNNKPIHSM